MPTYQYRCTECAHELEAFQKFSDDPLTVCPVCQGKLRKVFSPVGVVFKGSGFYSTDNKTKKRSALAPAAETTKSGAGETATPTKADSTKESAATAARKSEPAKSGSGAAA